jgi:hypothetical protein
MLSAKSKGAKGEKRQAEVIGAVVKIMRIATGEEPEDYGRPPESEGKDLAAWHWDGRAEKQERKALGKKKRAEIARRVVEARWKPK